MASLSKCQMNRAALATVMSLFAMPVWGECLADAAVLKSRAAHLKDAQAKGTVEKQLKKAQEAKSNEIECHNALTRGWRTVHEAEAAAQKTGPSQPQNSLKGAPGNTPRR